MASEHLDVLVVGAGLSGIGAACRLEIERPGTSYAVLESRDTVGGTWDLFRYPGIRSDSDMHTLGYPFRPWLDGQALADGPSILQYVRDTADAYGVTAHVRQHHRVVSADWSSAATRARPRSRRRPTPAPRRGRGARARRQSSTPVRSTPARYEVPAVHAGLRLIDRSSPDTGSSRWISLRSSTRSR